MNKLHEGYKVVTEDLCSISAWCRVRYSYKRFTKPRPGFGPLCVFDSERSAELFGFGFSSCYYTVRIVPCVYERSKQNAIWFLSKNKYEPRISLESLPRGTVLAKRVKLVGEVVR